MLQTDVSAQLKQYKIEASAELHNILGYWAKYAPDTVNGGFIGRIDHDNQIYANAPKGSVMHARILWAFSAAYNLESNNAYLKQADSAFQYISSYFIDEENGGVYWSVNHRGLPLDTKKQVYANAFVIYALAEYYRASGKQQALDMAISLYNLLIEKSYDHERTGYLEAFTKQWQPIDDLRLSAKDANEKKTMNTHLHVVEAYANLYSVWPDERLKQQIVTLLDNFSDHIIDAETGHLVLFFDENWNRKSDTVSYGHDIEAAWLLLACAHIIKSPQLIEKFNNIAIKITKAAIEGLDTDNGLWYEYEPAEHHLVKQKHWWVQAEAMVGFFNAWEVSGDEDYLNLSIKNWEFIKQHILDKEKGEWVWGINADGSLMPNEDKVGIWKCPYHNGRACIEIIKRIK
ncbi:MAG: N-acyl-D-glucosamine 2-epimerase [Sphingobacteriaceae bacterium]|nr:MAG: N-acyl-D-glucosamine 2-epimerase [Sphingobacteriaceae bacterium]